MPITTCTRCAQLYVERSEKAANEPSRKCPACVKRRPGLDDDMLQHLVELSDNAESVVHQETRLNDLEVAANALVMALLALGFGDGSADVSGAEAVDVINTHLPALRSALEN